MINPYNFKQGYVYASNFMGIQIYDQYLIINQFLYFSRITAPTIREKLRFCELDSAKNISQIDTKITLVGSTKIYPGYENRKFSSNLTPRNFGTAIFNFPIEITMVFFELLIKTNSSIVVNYAV